MIVYGYGKQYSGKVRFISEEIVDLFGNERI